MNGTSDDRGARFAIWASLPSAGNDRSVSSDRSSESCVEICWTSSMSYTDESITIVVPGDLHLTERDQPNHVAATALIESVNRLIRPDFVQFIGDNVQNTRLSEFDLFRELSGRLQVPHYALLGDHDVVDDPTATQFQKYVREPVGSLSLRGVRFIRLNTLDPRPLGFSNGQLSWLQDQFETAREQHERVVVFQHHYPYKVCESFAGPGIDDWWALIDAYRPLAVICGHTHYGQIANNGRTIAVTTRSIGDPEGGPAGSLVIHIDGDDLVILDRAAVDTEPLMMITHPRESILATEAHHVVSTDDQIRVRVWSLDPIESMTALLDERSPIPLRPRDDNVWRGPLSSHGLSKGVHTVRVIARCESGRNAERRLNFLFDPTGRYTAIPAVRPAVETTAFC